MHFHFGAGSITSQPDRQLTVKVCVCVCALMAHGWLQPQFATPGLPEPQTGDSGELNFEPSFARPVTLQSCCCCCSFSWIQLVTHTHTFAFTATDGSTDGGGGPSRSKVSSSSPPVGKPFPSLLVNYLIQLTAQTTLHMLEKESTTATSNYFYHCPSVLSDCIHN